MASGLLTQLQDVTHAGHPYQPMVSTSSSLQCRGDDNGHEGIEKEEVLECSQESATVRRIPSARVMTDVVLHTTEEFKPNGDFSLGKEHSPSQASCPEPYYISLDDVTISIPDIACEEASCSQFIGQEYSHDPGNSTSKEHQCNLLALPNVSASHFGQKPSLLQRDNVVSDECHEFLDVPFHTSVGLGIATSTGPTSMSTAKPEHRLISNEECCGILFSGATNVGCISSGDYNEGISGCTSFLSHSSDVRISEGGETSTALLNCPQLPNNSTGSSCSQSLVLSVNDGRVVYTTEANQSVGVDDLQCISRVHDSFIYPDGLSFSHIDATGNTEMQEGPDIVKDSSKLVPINTFGSASDAGQTCYPMDEKANVNTELVDTGALCYEPPRFPSLDIPFFSCDLIQSGGDMQQEFSPLGIRRLTMSSMNYPTPLRLWDSPRRDNSPDALLKSAAKTFTSTPSIFKKRHRDLLSPLSDKRIDKKLETDMTFVMTSHFSRLDVMFDDNETREAMLPPSSMEKENSGSTLEGNGNCGQSLEGEHAEGRNESALSSSRKSEKETGHNNSKMTVDVDVDEAAEIVNSVLDLLLMQTTIHNLSIYLLRSFFFTFYQVQQSSGVLIERDMNDLLLYSPIQIGVQPDKTHNSSTKTPKNLNSRGSENAIIPLVPVGCLESVYSSAPGENNGDHTGNDAGCERFNM